MLPLKVDPVIVGMLLFKYRTGPSCAVLLLKVQSLMAASSQLFCMATKFQ